MMIMSTILGTLSAMVCALVLKHVDLRRNASLEFGLMLLASYFPYCAAEALELRFVYLNNCISKGILAVSHQYFSLEL